jgi:hypothetical protein
MVATVSSIAEVPGATAAVDTTIAHITWVSQGLPNLKWAIFQRGKNISGPLTTNDYIMKGLKPSTPYQIFICSSIDGKKWTKGRPIQFTTKQLRSTQKPKKGSNYSLPSEVTNVTSTLNSSSVTLNWTKGPSTTSVKITDGLGYLSPTITGSSYTIDYGLLNDVSLYIMSSSDDVNYTLGTEVRSVVPDVSVANITASITPGLLLTVTFTPPIVSSKLKYVVSTACEAPISSEQKNFMGGGSLPVNLDGTITYSHIVNNSAQVTIYCTTAMNKIVTLPDGISTSVVQNVRNTTYGTSIILSTGDPSLPQPPHAAVAVPKSDWSGWDISFKGSRGIYSAYNAYSSTWSTNYADLTSSTTETDGTLSLSADESRGNYAFMLGHNTNPTSGNVQNTSYLLVPLPYPHVTNPVVNLGSSTVTISWTPEIITIPNPVIPTKYIIINANYSTIVTTNSVTLNYSDLTPNTMVLIRTWKTKSETRAFFYTGPPVSGYTMSSNNTWMILVLIVILLLLLKKK